MPWKTFFELQTWNVILFGNKKLLLQEIASFFGTHQMPLASSVYQQPPW